MSDSDLEYMYKLKYLKYKKKYLELKRLEQEQEGGLISFKSGDYAFFGPESVLKEVLEGKTFTEGAIAPSVSTINNLFDNKNIYRVKIGDKDLELISSSGLKYVKQRAIHLSQSVLIIPFIPLAYLFGMGNDITKIVAEGIIGDSTINYLKKAPSEVEAIKEIEKGAWITKIKLEKEFKLEQIDSILPLLKNLSRRRQDESHIDSAMVITFNSTKKNRFKQFIKLNISEEQSTTPSKTTVAK